MYLFRRADGAMIFGDNANSIYTGQLWVRPTTGNMVELRLLDGSKFQPEFDVTTVFKDAEDNLYADIDEFNAASGTFFFRLGTSSSSSLVNGYLILPNSSTGFDVRFGTRAGFVYAIDQELTATGFAGVENTDWENIGGIAQE
jgi:hypothetical protein